MTSRLRSLTPSERSALTARQAAYLGRCYGMSHDTEDAFKIKATSEDPAGRQGLTC